MEEAAEISQAERDREKTAEDAATMCGLSLSLNLDLDLGPKRKESVLMLVSEGVLVALSL